MESEHRLLASIGEFTKEILNQICEIQSANSFHRRVPLVSQKRSTMRPHESTLLDAIKVVFYEQESRGIDVFLGISSELDISAISRTVLDVFLQVIGILSDQPQLVDPVKCLKVE